MIDAPRKHGAFDTRWPTAKERAASRTAERRSLADAASWENEGGRTAAPILGSGRRGADVSARGPTVATDVAAVGIVSRFDDAAGYGFIAADAGGPQLFFRGSNITAAGRVSLRDGERVAFEPREGGMGPEAMNVLPLPVQSDPA